jgi:hypothetical protein
MRPFFECALSLHALGETLRFPSQKRLRTFTSRTSRTSSARNLPNSFAAFSRGGEDHLKSEFVRAEPRATLFLHVLSEFAQRAVGCGTWYRHVLPKSSERSNAGLLNRNASSNVSKKIKFDAGCHRRVLHVRLRETLLHETSLVCYRCKLSPRLAGLEKTLHA